MESDPNQNEHGFPNDLEYGKFSFVKKLDSGGQGVVCLYRSMPQRTGQTFPEQVAVKFDPTTDTANLTETLFLRDMTKKIEEQKIQINIPKYYMHSSYKLRRFFVMTYLPESIEDLVKSKGELKRNEMLSETAVKMLDAVQKFHELGYLHRDIKPSNFRVMNGQVYLTDFGTYKAYKEADGTHIKECGQQFFGTIEYASIRT